MREIQRLTLAILFFHFPTIAFGDETFPNRTWEDSTGKHKIEAALVKRDGDVVHLKRKDNGKVITISAKRLSKADRTYLTKTLSESPKNTKQNDKKQSVQVNDKISYTGSWNNRKYGTSGSLRCVAIVKEGNKWTAKFDGSSPYGKFSYDVIISTKDDGKQIRLDGNSTVSGHRYKWSGSVKNGVMTGKYTATNGNNGTFRLKQSKK